VPDFSVGPILADNVRVDGILHLGALAVVLTLGYIGLDKQITKPLDEKTAFVSNDIKNLVEELIIKYGLVRDLEKTLFAPYCSYLIFLIRGEACLARRWRKACYFLRRQKDLTLFAYFTSFHVKFISAHFAICFLSLIVVAAGGIWPWPPLSDVRLLRVIFGFYIWTVTWLVVSLALCRRLLQTVPTVAYRCRDQLDAQRLQMWDYFRRNLDSPGLFKRP